VAVQREKHSGSVFKASSVLPARHQFKQDRVGPMRGRRRGLVLWGIRILCGLLRADDEDSRNPCESKRGLDRVKVLGNLSGRVSRPLLSSQCPRPGAFEVHDYSWIMEEKPMKALRGSGARSSSQAGVRRCTAAFSHVRRTWEPSLDLKREHARAW